MLDSIVHLMAEAAVECVYTSKVILIFTIREDLNNEDLELLILEIGNPRSRPFFVGTWYRPPSASHNLFPLFEKIVDIIDAENSEFYLLGDLNCNLLSDTPKTNTSDLLNILAIYNMTPLITEPTRITNTTQSLIDLCVTNTHDKIRASGVLSIGISDHSLVYLIRKSSYDKLIVNTFVQKRNYKNFNEAAYLSDLRNLNWDEFCSLNSPDRMWDNWLTLLISVIDKHAPIKKKRLGKRKYPWITSDVIQKMRLRDNLKKRFDLTRDDNVWQQYRMARNDCNNSIRRAKRHYFTLNIDAARNDPKKSWKLINDLSSRKIRNECNVKKVNINGNEVNSAPDISDAFNTYFTTIGSNLASKINGTNIDATTYIHPTNNVFCFNEINMENVTHLLKTINVNKATGPDNIPGRLLKIAAEILSPSLTVIFNKSLSTGIYPNAWKMAKVLPIYKSGKRTDLSNYRPISTISTVAKLFGRIVHDQFYSYLTNFDLLSEYQSGFRPMYSTVTALLETTNNW